MRIIAGKYRSRKLFTLEGLQTRPTLDQTKEAIFSSIGGYIPGFTVLDVFGGSGALSLESLSRGAKNATIIDANIDAINIIKSNANNFGLDEIMFQFKDFHIHIEEGATPKDGPSAGITLTTALISALTNLRIDNKLAMTGEITLRGKVLPIGGLKEKSIGANRNGIKRILIPYDNIADLDEVPKEIKENIEYIPVKDYIDVFKIISK